MSAVAPAETLPVSVAPPVLKPAEAVKLTLHEIQAKEQKRWMIWFGLPALVASIFVGAALGTGHAWYIGFAIAAILVDIFVIVWLAMSSDTNGVIGDAPSHH